MLTSSKWIAAAAKALAQWNAKWLQGVEIATTAPLAGQLLRYNTTTAKWEPSSVPLRLKFPIPGQSTGAGTYSRIAILRFSGTTAVGSPSMIRAFCTLSGAGPSGDMRIQDTTNNLTICSITGNTNTTEQLKTFSTPANLPAAEATWELQARVTAGITASIAIPYFEINWA